MSPTNRRHYAVFTLFMVVLGVLVTTALHTNASPSAATVAGDRREELVQLVQNLEARKSELVENLARLREESSRLGEQAAARRGLYEGYTSELDRMNLVAGLVAVEGQGILVRLADNPEPPDDASDPNNYIVHDYDLRVLVNALWAGGAEAMAINDQRLVASSAVRCVGTTVLVNSTRLGSPFIIRAIGDPAALKAALARDPGARLLATEYAKIFGLKLSVESKERVTLPAYQGSLVPRELQSAGKGAS